MKKRSFAALDHVHFTHTVDYSSLSLEDGRLFTNASFVDLETLHGHGDTQHLGMEERARGFRMPASSDGASRSVVVLPCEG